MKKTYITPEVKVFAVQTEGSILFGSPGSEVPTFEDDGGNETGASGALSTGWGKSGWTETDEEDL